MQFSPIWQVNPQIPLGNAVGLQPPLPETAEVRFTPDPRGTRPLWFHFKLQLNQTAEPAAQSADPKLRLVMAHYQTMLGAKHPAECRPVFKPPGQWWTRLPAGRLEETPDGQMNAVWVLNQPLDGMEIALNFPYTDVELQQLWERGQDFWQSDAIGFSQAARQIVRLANAYTAGKRFPGGLYLMARAHGCDMPAAWVLDGMLQRFSVSKNNPFAIWAVPLADPDAFHAGASYSAPSMQTAWNKPWNRHEIKILQQDIAAWLSVCRPVLAVNLQAAPLAEKTGIYACLPSENTHPEARAQALKWANVIKSKLGGQYAAQDFVRPEQNSDNFQDWFAEVSGQVCALTLHIPWASSSETVFSPKKYREAGRGIADALLEKRC